MHWTLERFACATYGKHFSLGDHQDRLASSFFCSQAASTPAPASCFVIPLGKITLGDDAANRLAARQSKLPIPFQTVQVWLKQNND
jgi:hypothetical protein